MNQNELNDVVRAHEMWVDGKTEGKRADLVGKDLSGLDLSGRVLCRADFSCANLARTNLFQADLTLACLSGAWMHGTNLFGARLRGANLSGADLRNVDVRNADFSGAGFYRCVLQGIRVNWNDLNLVTTLLWRAAREKRDDELERWTAWYARRGDLCWNRVQELVPETVIRRGVQCLLPYLHPDDNIPEILALYRESGTED